MLLFTLSFANFVVGLGAFVIIGIFTPMSEALGLSEAQTGWIFSVFAMTYAIVSPLLVAASGSWDRRTVLGVGTGLLLCANVFGALADDASELLLARVLAAIGAAVITPVIAGVALSVAPPGRQARYLAVSFSGMTVAQIAGIPAGAWLAYTYGWSAGLWFTAGMAGLALMMILIKVPRHLPTMETSVKALAGSLLVGERLMAVLFSAFYMASIFVVQGYFAPLLEARLGLDRDGLTLFFVINGIGAVAGTFLGSRLSSQFAPLGLLVGLCIAQIILLPALTTIEYGPIFGGILILVWSTLGWCNAVPQQMRLLGIAPQARELMMALNASALYLGIAVGPVIGGFVVGGFGLEMLGPAGAAVAAVAAIQLVVSQTRIGR